ncbi:MAG: Holliday junction branch migration protein RuvA [Rhodobacter sp.]|nr:Holliday junction branch migration protein RuvA [Rhodobacter sp.]
MIGRLSGRLEYRAQDHVLIDVRGVGYIVYVSDRTLAALPGPGEAVALYTELVVREDLLQLFGYPTLLEKEWHRLLTTVQGIGAKAGLSILGALGPEGVARAITLGDARAIQAAPGVGPKLAQRLVLELKAKAPSLMAQGVALSSAALVDAADPDPVPAAAPDRKPMAPSAAQTRAGFAADALSALANLGYSPGDAAQAVAAATGDAPEADTPTLIRMALKRLAPKG